MRIDPRKMAALRGENHASIQAAGEQGCTILEVVSCCIADGCGARYDMNAPDERSGLRLFWRWYCPKHRTNVIN